MRGRRNTLTNKVRPLNLQLDLYDEPASMIVSDVIINIQDVEEDNNNNGGNTNAKSGFSIPKPELGLNMKDPLWSAVQAGNLVLLQDLLQNPIIRDEVTELGSEGECGHASFIVLSRP